MLYYKNYAMIILMLLPSGNLSARYSVCKEVPLLFGVCVLLAVSSLCFLSLALSEFGNWAGVVSQNCF